MFMEKKYLIIIIILCAGLATGLFLLIGKNKGNAFDFAKPAKEWIKISPRVSEQTTADASSSPKNTAKTSTLAKSKTTPDKTAAKTAKISAPAVVWCGQSADKVKVPALIISEIAWMGTSISATDEWIEIKNVFRQDLDISGWQLQNKNQSLKISFKNGTVIPTGGFYLLERTDDTTVPAVQADLIYTGSLANSNEALYLFDDDCQLQDTAIAAPNWPAGDNKTKQTMERTINFLWKTSAAAGGTPKAENTAH